MVRIYIAIAAAVALAGGLWYWHHLRAELADAQAQAATLTATLETERANRATEKNDRENADASAKNFDAINSRIHDEPRIDGVYVCPASVPRAAGKSRAAPVVDEAATGRVEAAAAADPDTDSSTRLDVSVAVDAYATDCAVTAAQLVELQAWERDRTH